MRKYLLAISIIAFFHSIADAQVSREFETVTMPANHNMANNFWYRVFLGKHYRHQWVTPVKMRILNLSQNGYSILREGGSRETFNLRLSDSTGREFVARSIKKELAKALPQNIQKSFAGNVMNDLMSANFPYGPLMVPPLANAAGVMHCNPELYMIEIDTIFHNNFISESGRMIVLLEERPDKSWSQFPIFHHATQVVNTEQFLTDRLNNYDSETNAEQFLKSRLLDILIGDWSRHEDQYRWAVLDSNHTRYYECIPRDRDHAFYKFNDGVLNKISLLLIPKTVTFNKNIKSVRHLNEAGKMLGKLILPTISKEKWFDIVDEFQKNISDDVIKEAVSQLPEEIYAQCGQNFITDIQSRRDQIAKAGEKLYNLIFQNPDIISTNSDEIIRIQRLNKSQTLVEIFKSDSGVTGQLIFSRKFVRRETKSINIFALEGDDVVEVNGVKSGIRLIIHAGPGRDIFKSSSKNRRVKYYDSKDSNYYQEVIPSEIQ